MADAIKKPEEEKAQQVPKVPGYQSQLDDIMGKIQNREKFNYDINGDALYSQFKDRYTQQGKLAMQDTMGQAAALTGGYGNSYAQNVGQQAYQGYMQGLNDKIPELYQLALDKYNREGNALMEQYGLLNDQQQFQFQKDQFDWQKEQAQKEWDWRKMVWDYEHPVVVAAPSSGGGGNDGGSSGGGRGGNQGGTQRTYKDVLHDIDYLSKNGGSAGQIKEMLGAAQKEGTINNAQKEIWDRRYNKKK